MVDDACQKHPGEKHDHPLSCLEQRKGEIGHHEEKRGAREQAAEHDKHEEGPQPIRIPPLQNVEPNNIRKKHDQAHDGDGERVEPVPVGEEGRFEQGQDRLRRGAYRQKARAFHHGARAKPELRRAAIVGGQRLPAQHEQQADHPDDRVKAQRRDGRRIGKGALGQRDHLGEQLPPCYAERRASRRHGTEDPPQHQEERRAANAADGEGHAFERRAGKRGENDEKRARRLQQRAADEHDGELPQGA